MHIDAYISLSMIVWGILGALCLIALSFQLSMGVAVWGHLISCGGIGVVGEAFSWRRVMKMTWFLGRAAAPVGFVIAMLTSIFGWGLILLPIGGFGPAHP